MHTQLNFPEDLKHFLLSQTVLDRVQHQQTARLLLFGQNMQQLVSSPAHQKNIRELQDLLSPASEIFLPDPVQTSIYSGDSGTHFIPGFIKRTLIRIRIAFIVRPGSIDDACRFVKWAHENHVHYTIRGAATWPFGGSVPLNDDIVLDLSALDFMQLNPDAEMLAFGAGVIFPKAKGMLKRHNFVLKQEITNPGSGTIAGWIATGGFGLGSYKYGHIRESVVMLLVIKPNGELLTLKAGDELLNAYFGSEGQIGVIAGGILKVRRDSFSAKPYAFSFGRTEDAQQFMNLLQESNCKPVSVLYFDQNYIRETALLEKELTLNRQSEALQQNNQPRITEAQEDLQAIGELDQINHVVVLNFDENEDYQQAIRTRLIGQSNQQIRIGELKYRQLHSTLAHKLWNHRYLPVQLKQRGPSMLVSETVLPLSAFTRYQHTLRHFLNRLLQIELKSEAHLLPGGQILIQSIVLADTRTLRHKIYFALVPLMNEVAVFLGARPYGIGIWNHPLLKYLRKIQGEWISGLQKQKSDDDPRGLINRGKFINPRGQKLAFRAFSRITPLFNHWLVSTTIKRQQGRKMDLSYPFERMVWSGSGFLFPKMIPPRLHARERDPLSKLIAPCAECDSCERVCPTSDVFGLYGPATPITRRETAQRLVNGENLTTQEALGFLVCTRCDNCTHICPTDIPLTKLFDLVEADNRYIQALGKDLNQKKDFIDRFWQIMKESPVYIQHTRAEQKEDKSHLQHGLKIIYQRGFEYGNLYIDPNTCIHCGMCSSENACMYGARESRPRQIPELLNINCALCNACVNYCPQNKSAQEEREYTDHLIYNAMDLEEKKYWIKQQSRIRDTTIVHRSTLLTEMADRYVTEEIIMEIDKESSTGQIPVSGMGQGDRHMGIGFDAERFSHFHIVGPAQNRLHEGDPNEELSIILGKREDYCKFDPQGRLVNPVRPTIKLMTPVMYNAIPLQSNGQVELALIKVAEKQKSLVVLELERMLEYYDWFIRGGNYTQLPPVIMPRVDHELIHRLIVNPRTHREFLTDLWRMPVFEVEYHAQIGRTLSYIFDSTQSQGQQKPLISAYLEISEYDLIGAASPTSEVKEKVTLLLNLGVDILHIHGLRNKDEYFVTSHAVRALHHYLLRIGRRHELSIIASGGIRLASDTQKTIQRGAEATLIDFAALLALDPSSYKAIVENKAATEKLLNLDIETAVKRLNNQAESRKVQILEVLGAAGFKDIKKTVGEEGRLIDFHLLENRIQRQVFENEDLLMQYDAINQSSISENPVRSESLKTYGQLKKRLVPLPSPHDFYRLGEANQTLYKRDYVWPGTLIETLGRMAAGDPDMLDFKNVKATGLLGDGFDVMKILYNKDPMDISDAELDQVSTSLPLDKGLVLSAPWMFGGKSVGSIGLDTWRAHVMAARELGIQYDTGEGGYPTCFFLNSRGEPIFFTENQMQLMKPCFVNGMEYTIRDMRRILAENNITEENQPELYEKIKHFPSLKPFQFMVVVDNEDQPYVSTEMKTGLFGVTKETIRRARRVVIAYSQGAKMGIGGHILAKKVNKLVSYLRGIEGIEHLNTASVEQLYEILQKIASKEDHPLKSSARESLKSLDEVQSLHQVTSQLKDELLRIQEEVYRLHEQKSLDEIDFENIIRACESIIDYSYTSIISPFPFHNCYSIEDVKAFIDVVHMINPDAVVSIKVSPSIDIEFIAAGLARISKDNTEEILKARFGGSLPEVWTNEMKDYASRYGMKIEIWLDGPRGGTGASPNIIKGQMGMHIEYAIPLIHNRLVRDGLRNFVTFMAAGGIRTYEDVIKAVALGADGVIWGTAPMVAVGCDRNRNCHDGCSRGIATSNLIMQKLRDVERNTQQIINAFTMMQMQVIRALAALGMKDIRELRGRFDKIHWLGLKERVDHRFRFSKEIQKEITRDEQLFMERLQHETGQSNCGVAAVAGSVPIPGIVLDEGLNAMRNRGMDGVGIAKTMCFPDHPEEYAYRVMIKNVLQSDIEDNLRLQWQASGKTFDEAQLRMESRNLTRHLRNEFILKVRTVFLDPVFEIHGESDPASVRETYKTDITGEELDYRNFGGPASDPGDIYCFFVRVRQDVLKTYIENQMSDYNWKRFFAHQFPEVTPENYQTNPQFLRKAEDVFVFRHGTDLTRILYVSDVSDAEKKLSPAEGGMADLFEDNYPGNGTGIGQLAWLRDFIHQYPYAYNTHRYVSRKHKLAAVMSNGKNFAVWKTAGREIPWKTPDAPNNIIHVRLATGSIVEQMNAHPFAKLHTALTHNGETTNYEALKQRVEQFDLAPLATTDTEVAALKFHLTAEEWSYPDWALFESFSPTTGDDLLLIDPALRHDLEQVQRVEFSSSPDGPYQYLCLRHDPNNRVTERVDLKDPADLRPNVTGFWKENDKVFSLIASEEQAIHTMLRKMDELGIVNGSVADQTLNSSGMISRFSFNEDGRIYEAEFIDRYGRPMSLPETGRHYSVRRSSAVRPVNLGQFTDWLDHFHDFFASKLAELSFENYHWLLDQLASEADNDDRILRAIRILTWLRDNLRTLNPGEKAVSSLQDITEFHLNHIFDSLANRNSSNFVHADLQHAAQFITTAMNNQTLVLNAAGFLAEGTDPALVLSAFLNKAYELNWRNYIIYRAAGQRLISTAVMGKGDTDDVVMDVYGSAGEYFGAFMQGGVIRMHGNAQNFCGMTMHHGTLIIHGNAGKVNGFASKGGKVIILGNVVDRGWTNSVNDSRCQDLEIFILGSATKYAGESLMGGNFFFGGMHFDMKGRLCFNERPYMGTKMLGGASRGKFVFFDPLNALHEAQYTHGLIRPFEVAEWDYYLTRIKEMFSLANIPVYEKELSEFILVEGDMYPLSPESFKLIVPRGGLKGYESH